MASSEHWLSLYANDRHTWQPWRTDTAQGWQRRIGIVESGFDIDGRHFEGRADITGLITVEARSKLSTEQFREKIVLAWAALRAKHVLLSARSLVSDDLAERRFIVETPKDGVEAIERARETVIFLDDFYKTVDVEDFYQHCYNTGRLFDQNIHSAKLFIFPFRANSATNSTTQMQFIYTAAHDITDGE